MIAGARGLCDSNLAVGVKGFVAAGRAYENRRIKLGAEELHASVDLGHVPETAREELEFQEPLAVRPQRDLVIDAGGHVAEMRRRHVFVCPRLEVEDVDCVLRAFNKFAVRRRPNHRIRQFGWCFHAVSRYCARCAQRTSRQVLKKTAAAGRQNNRRRHSNFFPATALLIGGQ